MEVKVGSDDNYYDASDEFVITNTGEKIFPHPVYLQKVSTDIKNKNFIMVGVQGHLPQKGEIDKKERKKIFMRRTPELEASERQMIKNFAKAILPDAIQWANMRLNDKEKLERIIAEQEEAKAKMVKLLNRKHEREMKEKCADYDRLINLAKQQLADKYPNHATAHNDS